MLPPKVSQRTGLRSRTFGLLLHEFNNNNKKLLSRTAVARQPPHNGNTNRRPFSEISASKSWNHPALRFRKNSLSACCVFVTVTVSDFCLLQLTTREQVGHQLRPFGIRLMCRLVRWLVYQSHPCYGRWIEGIGGRHGSDGEQTLKGNDSNHADPEELSS